MKSLVAAALMSAALGAQAKDISVALHGLSYHADRSQTFNETNPGVGVVVKLTETVDAEAGTYKNSYRKQTEYVAVAWLPLQYGAFKAGVFGGAGTGYQAQTGHKISGLAGAQINVAITQNVSAVVRWVPPAPGNEKTTSVTTFSAQVGF